MQVDLPADQQTYLEGLVSSGRFPTVGDAIREGVELLISHEDLKGQVQIGLDQADRGELIDFDTAFQSLRALAKELDGAATH